MLQLQNNTPYQAERAAVVDKDGNQVWVVVVKATYVVRGDGLTELAPGQEPVCRAPRYAGPPGQSSLLREAELIPEHPGTDVTVLGTAHAPGGQAISTLDVSVSVGPVRKVLRVVGDRIWTKGVLSPRMTEPASFLTMPVTYERAYGGTSVGPAPGDGERHPRNPIGAGFATRAEALLGRALPNIEDPAALIEKWDSRPSPAGFGPIPADWSPRLEHAGTFDGDWARTRMPLLPTNYDACHAQSAHPDLVAPQALRGGEMAVLENLTSDSPWSFRIPRAYLTVTTFTKGGRVHQEAQLDRVIIEPDAKTVSTVWRAALNCRARVRDVIRTVVDTKRLVRWQAEREARS
jgi:hypothetical protein